MKIPPNMGCEPLGDSSLAHKAPPHPFFPSTFLSSRGCWDTPPHLPSLSPQQ